MAGGKAPSEANFSPGHFFCDVCQGAAAAKAYRAVECGEVVSEKMETLFRMLFSPKDQSEECSQILPGSLAMGLPKLNSQLPRGGFVPF